MTNRITLDDVLDYFLVRLEENPNAGVLAETIARWPQFADELREFEAFRKINAMMVDPVITPEKERELNEWACEIAQRALREAREKRGKAK